MNSNQVPLPLQLSFNIGAMFPQAAKMLQQLYVQNEELKATVLNYESKLDPNAMAERFLGWRLPEDFRPDNHIVFNYEGNQWPTGTNLFTYEQARRMFDYCLTLKPSAPSDSMISGVYSRCESI